MTANVELPSVSFETFKAPEEAPHPYRAFVEKLIEAGPDEVATLIVDTEAEAKQFVLDMQKAAAQLDKSGRKRILTPELDVKGKTTGRIKVGVSVGPKITRKRGGNAEAPAEAPAAE